MTVHVAGGAAWTGRQATVGAGRRVVSSVFEGRWRALSRRLVPAVAVVLVASLAPGAVRAAWAAAPPPAPGASGEVSVPVGAGTARQASASQTDGPGVTSVDRRTLPRAASADVAAAGAKTAVGGLPISLSAVPGLDSDVLTQRTAGRPSGLAASKVSVTVVDETVAQDAGIPGVVFTLAGPPAAAGTKVKVSVDYSTFTNAYGAGYGERLRLVRLPECVLTRPSQRECHTVTDLGSRNVAGAVSTQLTLSGADSTRSDAEPNAEVRGAGVVLALMSTPSSDGATFSATSLSPTYSWVGRRAGWQLLVVVSAEGSAVVGWSGAGVWRCRMTPGRWTGRRWRRTGRPRGWVRAGTCSSGMWSGRTGRAPRTAGRPVICAGSRRTTRRWCSGAAHTSWSATAPRGRGSTDDDNALRVEQLFDASSGQR